MSVTPETLNRINSLKQGIEAATGETYTDLTEGVQALKDGYGQGEAKVEQEKTVDITKNGTVEVLPDTDKVLSKVTVNANVAFDGEIGKPFIDTSKMTSFNSLCVANRINNQLENLDTSNGTNFTSMFQGCNVLTSIPQIDTSNGTNFRSMFQDCSQITTIPQLDTSNGTNFSNMFNSCSKITTIPQIDTSNGTNFQAMFQDCNVLTSIPQLDTSNGTNFASMFNNCNHLETVSITTAKSNLTTTTFQNCSALQNITIGEGWAVNIYLHYSNKLTVESLHGMIENLADLTGLTAKTFQIGATNLAKIDEAHITMLQNKNWNYS